MELFKAGKIVTVICRTTDGRTDATTYICRACAGCSWPRSRAAACGRNRRGGAGAAL